MMNTDTTHTFQLHVIKHSINQYSLHMQGEEISTEVPIHIYCNELFNLFDPNGKVQIEITIELSFQWFDIHECTSMY